jgi:hypothetical protein
VRWRFLRREQTGTRMSGLIRWKSMPTAGSPHQLRAMNGPADPPRGAPNRESSATSPRQINRTCATMWQAEVQDGLSTAQEQRENLGRHPPRGVRNDPVPRSNR